MPSSNFDQARLDAVMRDFAAVPVWMAPPLIGQAIAPPVPLVESIGTCCLEAAMSQLKSIGYTDAEIDAAICEHHKWKRIELVFTKDAPTLIHANPSFWTWLEGQPLSRCRVAVLVDELVAVFDRKRIPLKSRLPALFLDQIVKQRGAWISGTDIVKACPELDGTRLDRLQRRLPECVRTLIESKQGTGYRLRPEAFET